MTPPADLSRFADQIAQWAVPAVVAPFLAAGLRPETARLVLTGPTGARASRLLASHCGALDPGVLDPADALLLAGGLAALDAAVAASGCVWHGGRVRAILRGSDVAAVVSRFGEAARTAAFRHPAPGGATATEDLSADIERDGASCREAWIAALPLPARRRMRLVYPAAEPVPDRLPQRAALFRTLAAERGG